EPDESSTSFWKVTALPMSTWNHWPAAWCAPVLQRVEALPSIALAAEPPASVELADAAQPVRDSRLVKPDCTTTPVNVAVASFVLSCAVTARPACAVEDIVTAFVVPTCRHVTPSVL